MMNPLNPLVMQAAKNLIDKKTASPADSKALEAEIAELLSPLVQRMERIERRLNALERANLDPNAPHADRADDI